MENLEKYELGAGRLLRTPAPFIDECLMGYVLRLTQENLYERPSWIFDLAGLKINLVSGGRPSLFREYSDLTALQWVTGLSHRECEEIRYKLIDFENSVVVLNHYLPIESIRFGSPKVCPECLKQDDYCRIVWDLFPFTACPSHKTILIDKCPRCKKRLSWMRNRVSVCRCGCDWRVAMAVEAESSGLEVSRQILKLFCLPPDEVSTVYEINNPLYALEMGDLFRALRFIADWYLLTRTGSRLKTNIENVLCHQAYTRAFIAFKDWPKNFHKFLDQVKRLSGKEIRDSSFYRRAVEMCERSSLYFIAVAVEDYVDKQELSWGCNDRVPPQSFRRFLTKPDACRSLRIEPKWLDLLIEQGKLEVTQRWGESEVLVSNESIISFKKSLNNLLHIRSVAEVLCIQVADVKDLIRYGCLKAASGSQVDGLPDWSFTQKDVYSFVDAICDRIVTSEAETPKDLVGGREVLARLRRVNAGVGHFTTHVLSGEIVPVGATSNPGFAGLLFLKDDVSNYLNRLGKEVNGGECQSICIPEYKLWTKALMQMMKTNLRISSSGIVRNMDDLEVAGVSIEDLTRIAIEVFSRAAPR
jgi:hypothetical protein